MKSNGRGVHRTQIRSDGHQTQAAPPTQRHKPEPRNTRHRSNKAGTNRTNKASTGNPGTRKKEQPTQKQARSSQPGRKKAAQSAQPKQPKKNKACASTVSTKKQHKTGTSTGTSTAKAKEQSVKHIGTTTPENITNQCIPAQRQQKEHAIVKPGKSTTRARLTKSSQYQIKYTTSKQTKGCAQDLPERGSITKRVSRPSPNQQAPQERGTTKHQEQHKEGTKGQNRKQQKAQSKTLGFW